LKALLCCAAAVAAAQCFSATAQPVTRLKARLTAFDGEVMTLEPLAAPPAPSSGKQPAPEAPAKPAAVTVSVTSDTRYVSSDKGRFDDIKPGGYAGAALVQPAGDHLRAQEVFLYSDALRGTGEGRFPEGDRLIVNGTVGAVKPSAPEDRQDGILTLHYHGSVLTGLGRGKTLCEGRASPPAYASALACEADAVIEVLPGTPVSSLSEGDKSLLVPGSLVTVAVAKTADGKSIAPGVVVEAPPPVEKSPAPPLEKPQTPP
jgi:hypothetical protein